MPESPNANLFIRASSGAPGANNVVINPRRRCQTKSIAAAGMAADRGADRIIEECRFLVRG